MIDLLLTAVVWLTAILIIVPWFFILILPWFFSTAAFAMVLAFSWFYGVGP